MSKPDPSEISSQALRRSCTSPDKAHEHGEQHASVRAIVRALEGNEAIVEIENTGCGRCHEPGGCGGQSIAHLFGSNERSYRLPNRCAAQVGDRVDLVVERGQLHQTATRLYVLPLLGVLAGAMLGNLWAGDQGAVIGAVAGGVLAWLPFRAWVQKGGAGNTLLRPQMLRRL